MIIGILIALTVGVAIWLPIYLSDKPERVTEMVDVVSAPCDTILEFGISVSEYDMEEGNIRKNEFFSTLMGRLGVPQKDIYELTVKSKGIFDMRQIKVGYHYHAFYTREDTPSLAYLVYEKDNSSYVVFSLKDSLSVRVHEKEIRTEINYAEVTITASLWDDVRAAGAPALLALKLSDVYAWSVDFFGLQKGDSFKALYEVTVYKDEILSVGNILYCDFTHQKKKYESFYYQEEGTDNVYWNEKGESMRKAFLKAPLSFTRISSGFSYARRHPVTRQVRPHTGIDYAAPTGTPVMSIGEGTVVYKGRKSAEGNMVKIKHNSVYTSAYLHLSRFGKGISVGSRVSQGQIIGYVGSTGRSTGPHLDFRIWKNGSPINPLKMESPPSTPIAKEHMGDFLAATETIKRLPDHFLAQKVFRQMVEKVVGNPPS